MGPRQAMLMGYARVLTQDQNLDRIAFDWVFDEGNIPVFFPSNR